MMARQIPSDPAKQAGQEKDEDMDMKDEREVEMQPLVDDNKVKEDVRAIEKPNYPPWAKHVALLVLIFQNSALILCMKQSSLTVAGDGRKALTTTIVCMVEASKVILCLCEIAYRRGGLKGLITELNEEIVQKPRDSGLLLVPAFLYLAQNNLLFVAVGNLEAAIYQVTSQLKILTTAGFSIMLLQRKLSFQQWASLLLLAVGCAIVQMNNAGGSRTDDKKAKHQLVGLVCCILAASTSGFAGVFCEKMLKQAGGNMSIRNIQLGVPGLVFGTVGALVNDYDVISQYGFLQGYTAITFAVVALHAGGGLLVTVIMKLADNIAKTFAIALSLIVSTVASIYLFNFTVTTNFFSGSCLVLLATFAYGNFIRICPDLKEIAAITGKAPHDDEKA